MFGTSAAAVLVLLGMILQQSPLWTAGIWLFAASVYYQLINLPVEWVASARSRAVLLQTGVLTADELPAVQRVMNAAVVGLLATATQSLLTLPLWILNRVRR
jgi:Zn-dependent membrane protease YugP